MIKDKKRLAALIAAAVTIGTFAGSIALPQTAYGTTAAETQKTPLRLWGNNRYETSAAVSKYGWTQSDYVVLANGEEFADALSAAPLAKALDAPILLTSKTGLSDAVKNEIVRLKAKEVYIIGKEGAVSSDTENSIKALGIDTVRIGGADRYETSELVADELKSITKVPVSSVAIVSGESFADALSMAPVAADLGMPILLTEEDKLPDEVAKFINDNKASIKDTYVIGGQAIISDDTAKEASLNSLRIYGSDRFETNEKILSWFKSVLKFDNVYVVEGNGPNGNEFADALSAAALAVKSGSPVILTYKTLDSRLQDFLKNAVGSSTQITAIGGEVAVPDSIVDTLEAIAGTNTTSGNTSGTAAGGAAGGASAGGAAGGGAAGSSVGGSTGGSAGSSASNSKLQELKNISNSFNAVYSDLKTDSEKSIINSIETSIKKVISNPNYDYSSDASSVKNTYNSLPDTEKTDIKNAIKKNIDTSTLLDLANYFGV